MCLIVVKNDKDAKFSKDNFQRSVTRNSDGMGIMYLEEKDGIVRVKAERLIGNAKQQLKLYEKHMDKSLFVLHHRFATHGAKNKMFDNCHPFKVMDMDEGAPIDLYMAHNGVIGSVEYTDDTMSDTFNFVENHIKPILMVKPELLWDNAFQKMITSFIGHGNKLVFLSNVDNYPRLLIFNKSAGSMVEGCWLSNTHSIYTAPVTNHNYNYTNNRNNFQKTYDNEDFADWFDGVGYSKHTPPSQHPASWDNDKKVWLFNGEEYKEWDSLDLARQAFLKQEKEKPEEGDSCNLPVPIITGKSQTAEAAAAIQEQDKENYKKELREAVLDGTMTVEDVASDFSEEELEELNEELEDILEVEAQSLSAMVRAMYDPENVDKSQLMNLINKMQKEFNYKDFELLVEVEPQIAADVMEHLMCERAEKAIKGTKAA